MNETDPGIFNSIEEWQQYLIDSRIGQEQSGQLAVAKETELVPVERTEPKTVIEEIQNSERFIDYPNRQKSLRAVDSNGKTVYAKTAVARKLYRCSCCPNEIDIGSEHVVTFAIQQSKRHDHHHVHALCFGDRLLDHWSDVKIVDTKETTPEQLTRKRRNHVNRQNYKRRAS